MRVKKQKRHRRAVRFYTACFGFREPFKILCDGTFVHHLLANQITPADTALANILGAPVKIFTTRCVLAELRSLGNSYSDALDAARKVMTASLLIFEAFEAMFYKFSYQMNHKAYPVQLLDACDHEKRKSAVACITEVIGENNPEHFFVATQDAELRNKFQEIPGVPVIYGLRNALFLDRPSTFQHEYVKTAEEERSHMTDLEYKMLKLKRKKAATDEANASSDANEDHILETRDLRKGVKRNRIDTKDKAQFKRKKAKGPNPLSCKKKKSEGNTRATSASGEEINADSSTRSSRKRKRPRKSKITIEPIVG